MTGRGRWSRFVVAMVSSAWLSSLAVPHARAWGNAGHAQIAEIAWNRLDQETRGALSRALEHHPRFAEDFAARMPSSAAAGRGRARWIFLQASIWPDVAREFEDHADPALRALHRGGWHYVNLPLTLSPDVRPRAAPVERELSVCAARKGLNIVQALKLCLCKLENAGTAPAERALYLSWLVHLVGDLHQPLHAVSLYSGKTLRDGDRGGNAIRPAGVASLHAAWDRLPGPTGRRDRIGIGPAAATVRRLLSDASLVEAGRRAAGERSLEAWLRESQELAREYVYTDGVLDAVRRGERDHPRRRRVELPALDEAYMTRAAAVSRKRIVEAGFRLAAILARLPP